LLCSSLDANRFLALTGTRALVVPNTVKFLPVRDEKIGDCVRLLFVGTLSYPPNIEGIFWFMQHVWPLLRAADLTFTLDIVGFEPPAAVLELGMLPGVRVQANPVNLHPIYDSVNIVIVPLFSGSGTRIKLIEAASRKRAVVATMIGSEGLGFQHQTHLLIADDAAGFADAVLLFGRNPAVRQSMAQAAFERGEASFEIANVQRTMADSIADLQSEQ
jgi:glycosyltransferase involved in cell wall biosynthesis